MATKREENILGNSFKDWEKLAPLLMEAATDKSTLLNFAFLDSCDKISRLLAKGSPAATITERFLAKSIRSATEIREKSVMENENPFLTRPLSSAPIKETPPLRKVLATSNLSFASFELFCSSPAIFFAM